MLAALLPGSGGGRARHHRRLQRRPLSHAAPGTTAQRRQRGGPAGRLRCPGRGEGASRAAYAPGRGRWAHRCVGWRIACEPKSNPASRPCASCRRSSSSSPRDPGRHVQPTNAAGPGTAGRPTARHPRRVLGAGRLSRGAGGIGALRRERALDRAMLTGLAAGARQLYQRTSAAIVLDAAMGDRLRAAGFADERLHVIEHAADSQTIAAVPSHQQSPARAFAPAPTGLCRLLRRQPGAGPRLCDAAHGAAAPGGRPGAGIGAPAVYRRWRAARATANQRCRRVSLAACTSCRRKRRA